MTLPGAFQAKIFRADGASKPFCAVMALTMGPKRRAVLEHVGAGAVVGTIETSFSDADVIAGAVSAQSRTGIHLAAIRTGLLGHAQSLVHVGHVLPHRVSVAKQLVANPASSFFPLVALLVAMRVSFVDVPPAKLLVHEHEFAERTLKQAQRSFR